MKLEFTKHRIIKNDPLWFELGISWQTTEWRKNKYLITIALGFWSIYIRYGDNIKKTP
jgi:hypothetical protein